MAGLATALPFHRAVVGDPAFAPELHGEPGPFTVHTRWIETEYGNDIHPGTPMRTEATEDERPTRQTVTVEVDGKRLEVTLPAILATSPGRPDAARPARNGSPRAGAGRRPAGRVALRQTL